MKLLWVLLICLKEAQPAHVNVNVKVKANANNDIESDRGSPLLPPFVPSPRPRPWPPVQQNFPGNLPYDQQALLSSRSLSGGAGNQISRSSSRWLICQSALWTKECEEGKLILKTVKDISDKVCGLMCWDKRPHCTRYFFEEKSGDCALSTVTEGTTTSNGISGPELPSKLPNIRGQRSRQSSNADCSEFHFEACSIPDVHDTMLKFTDQGWEDRQTMYIFQAKDELDLCRRNCKRGSQGQWCNTYGFKTPSNNPVGADCALHNFNVDDYIHHNCYITIGRADKKNPEKYDSCLFFTAESTGNRKKCRSGYCDLDHFGEVINQAFAEDELDCMRICSDSRGKDDPTKICTHWKFHPTKSFSAMNENTKEEILNPVEEESGQCLMYHVDSAQDFPSYNCDMVVEDKKYNEIKCRQPIKPGQGYVTGNTSSPTETTSTTSTIPTTTTMDCVNQDIDVAFLFDASGSMPSDQVAVKNWMKKLIEIFDIDGQKHRAAIMQWDDKVRYKLPFEEGLTADELYDKIDNEIEHSAGGTYGGWALRAAFVKFFHGQGNDQKEQIVFFLTDGKSHDTLTDAAQLYHDNGIKIRAVFVEEAGEDVPQELNDMLGEGLPYENQLFLAENLDKLTKEDFIDMSGCGRGGSNKRITRLRG